MATLAEVSRPYEFLVRWDTQTGKLSGSHVGFSTVLLRDGVFASETPNPVQPVGAAGFPLKDILSQVQIDALLAVDLAKAELAAEKTAHMAVLAAKDAEIAALKALSAGP